MTRELLGRVSKASQELFGQNASLRAPRVFETKTGEVLRPESSWDERNPCLGLGEIYSPPRLPAPSRGRAAPSGALGRSTAQHTQTTHAKPTQLFPRDCWGGSRYTETLVGTDNLERRNLDARSLRGYPGYR